MPRTDIAHREITAPPPAVFAALTDPAALAAWLPPAGMTGRFEHADLRPGGSYRLVLTYDDPSVAGKTGAGTDVVDVRIITVDPDARIVQAVDFESDDPALAGTMIMTWTVSPTPAGTHVALRADDVPDGIPAADHAAGMGSSLANLAAFVESGRRQPAAAAIEAIERSLREVMPLVRTAFEQVGGQPEPGSSLEQAGLLDGDEIVTDYLAYGEAGLALDHLVYLVVEPPLPITDGTAELLLSAARQLGYSENELAALRSKLDTRFR